MHDATVQMIQVNVCSWCSYCNSYSLSIIIRIFMWSFDTNFRPFSAPRKCHLVWPAPPSLHHQECEFWLHQNTESSV